MYIAEQLKKKSMAEYLLYMWQVEDMLRAYGLDVEKMAAEYIPQFGLDAEKSEELKGWYGQTAHRHLGGVEHDVFALDLADFRQISLHNSFHAF